MDKPKIVTFSLNLDTIRLCERYYNTNEEVKESGILFKRKPCYSPLFFNELNNTINHYNPNIVIIVTQNEDKDSYFHTDFLPKYMNYNLLTFKQNEKINISIYVDTNNYTLYHFDYHDERNDSSLAVIFDSPFGIFAAASYHLNTNIIADYDKQSIIKRLNQLYDFNNVDYIIYFLRYPNIDNFDNSIEYTNISTHQQLKHIESFDIDYTKNVGNLNVFEIITKTRVLCFSWHTDQLPLCGQYNDPLFDKHSYSSFFSTKYCYNPYFFETIKNNIKKYAPSIIVISTEGDIEKGTFFHAEFLKRALRTLGYTLLDNTKTLSGNTALRLSIYVNQNYTLSNGSEFSENLAIDRGSSITYPVKTLIRYVNDMAFLAVHVPDDILNLTDTSIYLTKLINKYTKNNKTVFILGHFNYSLHKVPNLDQDNLVFYNETFFRQDNYKQGIQGITPLPNYRLKPANLTKRIDFNIDNYKDNSIAWHNRIYHTENANVIVYTTIASYPMLQENSEHLGVLGVYDVTNE